MKTGTVSAKKVIESRRLDAEFHLRGRKLKAVCTRRAYCVELTVDEMQRVLAKDKVAMGLSLHSLLERRTPAKSVEYDGHFGPNIFFTLDADDDKPTRDTGNPGARDRILRVIRDYIRGES